MNAPRDVSVPHEVPEQSRPQLVLPANRKLIRIKSIPALVGRAMLAYLERSHAGDELAFKEAAFLLGFNNRSTHLDSIRLAVLARRSSGEIVVREANGAGVIRDDDVMRGWLMREDFAWLLGAEWGIDVEASPTVAVPARAGGAGTVAGAPDRVVMHSIKTKPRDILVPVIELAQGKCVDPKDTAQVFAQMQVLAQEEHPPLLAATVNGLKYTKNGTAGYLTRDALNKRLHPENRKPRR